MGDDFRKVVSGEELVIPARTFNAFIDAARAVDNRRHDGAGSPTKPTRQSDILLVKNNSGADRGRFDVLGIDGPIFGPSDNLDEFQSNLALKGVVPTASHAGNFVVLLEPLPTGSIGRACVAGVCPVRLYVNDAAHGFADVSASDPTSLYTGLAGSAAILWKESGAGEVWGVVRIGACCPTGALGKSDAAIGQGSSGTVSIYMGAPGSETDSGLNVTAFSPLGSVGADKWVWLAWNGFGWYVISEEC